MSDARIVRETAERFTRDVHRVVIGQDETVRLAFIALVLGGHVLIEGVPGTAKTLLARTIARLIGGTFKRIQFTPDLMPSDIVGTSVYELSTSNFRIKEGPIFANVVLATQNPVEYEGTYPLPEAELDRFLFKAIVRYPESAQERAILRAHDKGTPSAQVASLEPLPAGTLDACAAEVEAVTVEDSVLDYVVRIVAESRASSDLILGASPRAGVHLLRAAKTAAAIEGRDFVTPDDVKALAIPTLRHRIVLRAEAEIEGLDADAVCRRVLARLDVPR